MMFLLNVSGANQASNGFLDVIAALCFSDFSIDFLVLFKAEHTNTCMLMPV